MTAAPLRIAHIGSLHCGEPTFREELFEVMAAQIQAASPDLVLVAGDLTANGYEWEFAEAADRMSAFDAPLLAVPGNHDARNVGYVHFRRLFGERHFRHHLGLDPVRAERLRLPGVTVVGCDSSQPDLEWGHIGQSRYRWIEEQFDREQDLKVVVLHHHLLPVPGAGRELSVISDAGDVLALLSRIGVDLVLSGHRHVPAFWSVNGILVANCSTASTSRLRGRIPPSWNEIRVDASTIKVVLHYPDGRAELTAIHSRRARDVVRDVFLLTEEFHTLNRVADALEA